MIVRCDVRAVEIRVVPVVDGHIQEELIDLVEGGLVRNAELLPAKDGQVAPLHVFEDRRIGVVRAVSDPGCPDLPAVIVEPELVPSRRRRLNARARRQTETGVTR